MHTKKLIALSIASLTLCNSTCISYANSYNNNLNISNCTNIYSNNYVTTIDSTAINTTTLENPTDTNISVFDESNFEETSFLKFVKNAPSNTIIKLSGVFTFTQSIVPAPGIILDFSQATINCNENIELFNIYNKDNVSIIGGSINVGSNTVAIKASGCNNFVMKNMTISGGGDFTTTDITKKRGVTLIYRCNNSSVLNCKFADTQDKALYVVESPTSTIVNNSFSNIDGYGIHLYYSDNSTICGNTLTKINGDGIYCSNCKKGTISGNFIKNVTLKEGLDYDNYMKKSRSGCGIFLSICDSTKVGSNITIAGKKYNTNTTDNTENYGIALNICNAIFIENNTINKCHSNGIHSSASTKTTIKNCKLNNTSETAIAIVPGTSNSLTNDQKVSNNSTIFNNTVNNAGIYGIWVYKAKNSRVAGNTVTKTKKDGIRLNEASMTKISGNTITTTTTTEGSGIAIANSNTITVGNKLSIGTSSWQKNTIKNTKKYGVLIDKSSKIILNNTDINVTGSHGIRLSSSPNTTLLTNKVTNSSACSLLIENSSKTIAKNNSFINSKQHPIMVKNSSGSNIKDVYSSTINKITANSTKATGVGTMNVTCKIKIGTKYYTCSRKLKNYTSSRFPKQKKGTKIYLYEYAGNGNVVIKMTTVS